MKGLLSIYPFTLRISYKYFSLKKHYDPEGEDALRKESSSWWRMGRYNIESYKTAAQDLRITFCFS